MKYTKAELDQKIWYRLLKVIFWIFFILSLVIVFFITKNESNTQVIDYKKTYEITGEKVRNMYGNTTQWSNGNYGSLSNLEIGKRVYDSRYQSDIASEMWNETMNGLEIYNDKYSLWEKVKIFTQNFGYVLIFFGIIQAISNYIFTGKNPLYS